MIHFSGIVPKKIDWEKIKASKRWRFILALLLPGVIYLAFTWGYLTYIWLFIGILGVIIFYQFKIHPFALCTLALLNLFPIPFLLILNQDNLALEFGIISFICWGIAACWSFFKLILQPEELHIKHPHFHIFETEVLQSLDPFLKLFFILILLFVAGLQWVGKDSDLSSFSDQRIVIQNASYLPYFSSNIEQKLEQQGFSNVHLGEISESFQGGSDSTFIFYRQNKALADELKNLMPRPTQKVYVVRSPALQKSEIEVVLGNLQIEPVYTEKLKIRVLGTPSKEKTEEVLRLLGETVEFIPMWNLRDYEKRINVLTVDSKVPVILYKKGYYVEAKRIQKLFPGSLIIRKEDQEGLEESQEDVLVFLR